MSTTDDLAISDLLTAAPLEGLDVQLVAGDVEEVPAPPITLLSQTGTVSIYDVNCATGASTKFLIPITAWGWKTRLVYFRANGGRIGLSPIFEWNRSFYAGSTPSVRFRGALPAGTKDLGAYWWYEGSSTIWWNRKAINC
ncbi:hypothetical protein [Streptomyces sp. NPDC048560]|uniref:hypothetical protein n=1 Tax=Streptomyces sp. NPDC048560 TaxID=3155488 RepID=UPI0034317BC2